MLIRLDSEDRISFYMAEAIKNNWTTRQLERQIHSNLWERLLVSNDRENVLAVARELANTQDWATDSSQCACQPNKKTAALVP
jgi:predicted nuclease of restriction endonuclease-like (RecB) superfamily